MAGMNLFMLVWGVRLVHTTWFQAISDFPAISVGISYLPVPLGGAITLLFVIERLWTGRLFQEPGRGRPGAGEHRVGPAGRMARWTF